MLILNFPIKPYSVNQYFYGNRAIKKREAVEWERSIIELIRPESIQKKIEDFKKKFNPSLHSLQIDLLFQYPHNILYTKKKQLSSKAFDISNVEKPLIDVICLSKYSTEVTKNLEIDDKYVKKMTSEKTSGDTHNITVKIQLIDLPHL